MINLKQSLIALAGMLLVGLVALLIPARMQGQGGNQQPLNVNVVNPAAAPVPIRDMGVPLRLPLQIKVNAFIRWGEPTFEQVIYTVPAGKRLVIEHVALVSDDLNAGNAVQGVLETSFRGEDFLHPFDLRTQAPVDGPVFVANHSFLAFADPGTAVWVTAIVDEIQYSGPGEGYSALHGTLSGYLEEVLP